MKKKELFLFCFVLLVLVGMFFYKIYGKGYIPFPGDLLVNSYSPWKYESYLGYNPGSYPTKFQYFDVIRQLYPWKFLVIDQLKQGDIPFWNPYNFSGTPLLANIQSQVFSPINIVYFVLPFMYGWTVSLVLQIILAFIFTYVYVRQLGLHPTAAILAALAYAGSLYMSVFFEYGVFGQTILWLPLILYAVEKFLVKLSVKTLLLLVFSVVFASFGGHLQIFAYLWTFALCYAFFRVYASQKQRKIKIALVFFSFFISIGIFSIQLLPSLELIGLSARDAHDLHFFLQTLLLHGQELIVFLSPDFYGNPATNTYLLKHSYPQTALYVGVIPLIFACSSLFLKKNNWVTFYLIAALIILIFITLNPISTIFYSLQPPIIASSSPTNAIFLLSFSLSILAGYGSNQWLMKKNKWPLLISTVFLCIVAAAYGFSHVFHVECNTKGALYSLGLLGVAFVLYGANRFMKRETIFMMLVILITIVDLGYFFQKFNPFVPKELVYPQTTIGSVLQKDAGTERVWGYGHATIQANVNIMDHVFSSEGYDPLYVKKYGELIHSSNAGLQKQLGETTRSDALFDDSLGALPADQSRQKVMNLLGIKYILDRAENGSTAKQFPQNQFTRIYDKDNWKLFKNKQAVPRVFLTSDYRVVHSDNEFETNFFDAQFSPLETVLLIEKPSFPATKNTKNNDSVSIRSYTPNEVVVQTRTSEKKLLFLSDTFYPGWKATIDGAETPILRADYIFRTIQVPKGAHTISFTYFPETFSRGLAIALASLLILSVVSVLIYMRKLRYAN